MYDFSFLVPTRAKVPLVYRLFKSIKETTSNLSSLEIVLGIDDDDKESYKIEDDSLNIKKIYFKRENKHTISYLFEECFLASSGRFVMMMNDDIVLKTKGWDDIIKALSARYPDDICLFHVNDLLTRDILSCHPIVSRRACLEIGFCDVDYVRYAPDDHIYDVYNFLAYLGYMRIFYLEDVIFHHMHDKLDEKGNIVSIGSVFSAYEKDRDLFSSEEKIIYRKSLALKLASLIDPVSYKENKELYTDILKGIKPYNKSGVLKNSLSSDVMLKGAVCIILITKDVRSFRFRAAVSSIKKHTSNFSLKIIDKSIISNVPEELNRVFGGVLEDYLVIMDDMVRLSSDWFSSLLGSFSHDVAIVAPLYKRRGLIYRSYVYVGDDFLDVLSLPLDKRGGVVKDKECMGIPSSFFMIDMSRLSKEDLKLEKLSLDYFIGVYLSLRALSLGYKVISSARLSVNYRGKLSGMGGSLFYTLVYQSLLECDKVVCESLSVGIEEGLPVYYRDNRDFANELISLDFASLSTEDISIIAERVYREIYPNLKYLRIRQDISRKIFLELSRKSTLSDDKCKLLTTLLVQDKLFINKLLFYIKLLTHKFMFLLKIKYRLYKVLLYLYEDILPERIKTSILFNKVLRRVVAPLYRFGVLR